MGTVSSKDTRRITFENSNFCMSSALAAKTLTLEDDNVLDLDVIKTVEKGKDHKLKDYDIYDNRDAAGGDLDYWANRIEQLKKEHREINKIVETEYEKTLEASNKMLEKPPISVNKIKPCFDYQNKIQQCYEANAHQPLVCSSLVQNFVNCVKSYQEENKIY